MPLLFRKGHLPSDGVPLAPLCLHRSRNSSEGNLHFRKCLKGVLCLLFYGSVPELKKHINSLKFTFSPFAVVSAGVQAAHWRQKSSFSLGSLPTLCCALVRLFFFGSFSPFFKKAFFFFYGYFFLCGVLFWSVHWRDVLFGSQTKSGSCIYFCSPVWMGIL